MRLDLGRRSLASLLSTAALTALPRSPLAAAPPPFSLTLPPDFVKISATSGQGVLLMAGDFRGMIAGTGAATTISVQRLEKFTLPPPAADNGAALNEAASTLARLRDAQSAAVGQSELIATSVASDGSMLSFEFVTPLVANGYAGEDSPSLKRHTLARALESKDGSGGGLVLWAGAREADWQAGAGDSLRAAAATFGVPQGDAAMPLPEPRRTEPARTNAHYGPDWAAASWK